MADNSYIYAVTRTRVKENDLLTDSFLQQLAAADSEKTAVRMLRDKGWEIDESGDVSAALEHERNKTWDFMREVLKEDINKLDVFLYANDFHNLKAAVKETLLQHDYAGIYIDQGTVAADTIRKAVKEKNFDLLPDRLKGIASEGLDLFLRTGDGQLLDICVDKAALDAIYEAGKKSGSEFLKLYAELTVASADIKIALRSARTGKDLAFLKRALSDCASLDTDSLAKAAVNGEDAIADYLLRTDYAEGVGELKKSMAQFERWCDNILVRKMRPQKINPFGIDPLAAYVLARENEIKSVRIILSGKRNGLDDAAITERIREMYA